MNLIEPFLKMLQYVHDHPDSIEYCGYNSELRATIDGHNIKMIDNHQFREIWVDGSQRYCVSQKSIPQEDNNKGNTLWRTIRDVFMDNENRKERERTEWYDNIINQ